MDDEHFFGLVVQLGQPWFVALALTMARAAGLLMALPQLAPTAMPPHARQIAVVALSAALVVGHPPAASLIANGSVDLTLAVVGAQEFLLGLSFGFVVHAAIAAVRIAGEVMGVEMGLSFAAIADPLTDTDSTPMSAFLAIFAAQLFLTSGFDLVVIRGLSHSLDATPLGQASLDGPILHQLTSLAGLMLRTALVLALPVMGATFALKLALAMLARATPRLQLFTLAFPLAIGLGLVVLPHVYPVLGVAVLDHLRVFLGVFEAIVRWPVSGRVAAIPGA